MQSLRKAPALLLTLCLPACGAVFASPEVEKCEQHIRSQLANPDSYNRGQHDSLNVGDHWQVGIEYGFVDENGNTVESAWQVCDFRVVDGKPDTSQFLNLEGSAERANPTPVNDR
jgi:hypothetical protein